MTLFVSENCEVFKGLGGRKGDDHTVRQTGRSNKRILNEEAGNVEDANLGDLLPICHFMPECRERTVVLLKNCSPMAPFRSSSILQLSEY